MGMKRSAVALVGITLCFSLAVTAQHTKILESNGHLSPVMVKITFLDDLTRIVMLQGIGHSHDRFLTHAFVVKTDESVTMRRIWLDTIATIQGTGALRSRQSEFTIALKDGTRVAARFTGGSGPCNRDLDPNSEHLDCRFLYAESEDHSQQTIDLRKVKSVDFLEPARRDREKNALFPTWRYSPFTGEKLP